MTVGRSDEPGEEAPWWESLDEQALWMRVRTSRAYYQKRSRRSARAFSAQALTDDMNDWLNAAGIDSPPYYRTLWATYRAGQGTPPVWRMREVKSFLAWVEKHKPDLAKEIRETAPSD
jgi:hypothetical protein